MVRDRDLKKHLEKQAIADVKYEYCWAIDNNDPDAFIDVFTEDGVLTARKYADSDPYLRAEGHDELRSLVHKRIETHDRQLGQHRPHNPVITLDGDVASGKWYMTSIAVNAGGDVEFEFGEYHETYRRFDSGWKIASSAVEYLEVEPALRS